jgi:hypothetical protein
MIINTITINFTEHDLKGKVKLRFGKDFAIQPCLRMPSKIIPFKTGLIL